MSTLQWAPFNGHPSTGTLQWAPFNGHPSMITQQREPKNEVHIRETWLAKASFRAPAAT